MKNFYTVAILLFTTFSCFSQNKKKIVDSIVGKGLNKFPAVGLVIGVYKDSKTTYYSYGTQNKDGLKKMDSCTVFEIGSATKTFTALLLAQEIQKGNLKPFEFIDNYLPKDVVLNCQFQKKILITDLASHQSGLPNLSSDHYFSELFKKNPSYPFRMVDDNYLFSILKATDSLQNYRQYQYNNYAFSLLGTILEKVSKKSYERTVQDQILSPLKMSASTFSTVRSSNEAGLYNQQGQIQTPLLLNRLNPAGGIKSNAVDLIVYLKALINNPEFAAAKRIIEQTYYEDANRKIGLGWEIGPHYLQKDGDTFGNSSLMRYSNENQIGIVVLSNHQNGQLVRDIMDGIYGQLTK